MYTGEVFHPCPTCNGFGALLDSEDVFARYKCTGPCHGAGWIKQPRAESVDSSIEHVINFYSMYARECLTDDCRVVIVRPRNHYCSKCRAERATRKDKREAKRGGKRVSLHIVRKQGIEVIVSNV